MKYVARGLSVWLLVVAGTFQSASAAKPDEIPNALQNYVRKAEPDFSWKLVDSSSTEHGNQYLLKVVSQKWQGIVWEHAVQVYEPKKIDHPEHMLLFVTGGSIGNNPRQREVEMGLKLAQLCGARVVTIHQVPNQPLLGNKYEDDLISETWLRYLKTGDENWPLLFPMVKSAVKTMDALELFAKSKNWNVPKGFVITGASKRGWTSWLTPVADKRIHGTAPIVIDTLNFQKQMDYQISTWGKYSEQIVDYTSKGLVRESGEPKSELETKLWRYMDPYTYRSQLTLPKLLINGTNDPYWVVDAMKNYWGDLVGPKHILMVPNAGHGLEGGQQKAFVTLAAFFRHVALKKSLPRFEWKYTNGTSLQLSMTADQSPMQALLWSAASETKDFRQSKWTSREISGGKGAYSVTLPLPKSGHAALYGELLFKIGDLEYTLTTQAFRD